MSVYPLVNEEWKIRVFVGDTGDVGDNGSMANTSVFKFWHHFREGERTKPGITLQADGGKQTLDKADECDTFQRV